MTTTEFDFSRPLYPIEQSFVVALRRGCEGFPETCTGRIEHLESGRCANFEHLQDLLGFIANHVNGASAAHGRAEGRNETNAEAEAAGGFWQTPVKSRPP